MSTSSQGQVASLRLNVAHRGAMQEVQRAKFIAGEGIEGDRHASPRVERQGYQVLLMDEETLAALDLSAGQVRENVTTNGINLPSLAVGQRVALGGQIVLQISKPCAPCSRMEEIRPGLQQELEGRRGMLASVVEGGAVEVGDLIRVL